MIYNINPIASVMNNKMKMNGSFSWYGFFRTPFSNCRFKSPPLSCRIVTKTPSTNNKIKKGPAHTQQAKKMIINEVIFNVKIGEGQ